MDLTSLLADLRARPDLGASDYNETLDLGWKVSTRQIRACEHLSRLKRLTTQERSLLRDALVAVLPGTPVGGCSPQCCSASLVRREQLYAKLAALAQLCRVGVGDGSAFTPALLDWLLRPPGRLLASPTARLLAGSPAAAARHFSSIERAASHPNQEVVEAVARALLASGDARARKSLVELLRDARPPVALAAARALRGLGDDPLARTALVRAFRHHPDDGVKYVALKILLGWGLQIGAGSLSRSSLERHRSAAHVGLRHAVARALGCVVA